VTRGTALLRVASLATAVVIVFVFVASSGSLPSERVRDAVDPIGAAAVPAFIVGSALLACALFPGPLLAGYAADRFGHRPTLVVLYTVQGASLLMLGLGDGLGWYAVSSTLYGLTVWSFAGVISAACGLVAGPRLASAGVALGVTLMGIGQMIGPIVGGLVADPGGSYARAFVIASTADLVGVAGVLLIRLPARRTDGSL